MTPFEISFLAGATSFLDPLFLLNRVVDLLFLFDMGVQFMLAYPSTSAALELDPSRLADQSAALASA